MLPNADTYRAAVRQAARYSEQDDGGPYYNPFAKIGTGISDLNQAGEKLC